MSTCKSKRGRVWTTTDCELVWDLCKCPILTFFYYFFTLSFIFGVIQIMSQCSELPRMSLEAVSVEDIRLYQNNTESAWQLTSSFNVTLNTWNPSTLARCYCTGFRHVIVSVGYRDEVIFQQEFPLSFGLKPRKSRLVVFDLSGDGFRLKNPDSGPFLQNELESDKLSLDFYFDARVMQDERLGLQCQVVAKIPSNTSQSAGANGLLQKNCTILPAYLNAYM